MECSLRKTRSKNRSMGKFGFLSSFFSSKAKLEVQKEPQTWPFPLSWMEERLRGMLSIRIRQDEHSGKVHLGYYVIVDYRSNWSFHKALIEASMFITESCASKHLQKIGAAVSRILRWMSDVIKKTKKDMNAL